jgi:hypothetical protein
MSANQTRKMIARAGSGTGVDKAKVNPGGRVAAEAWAGPASRRLIQEDDDG